MIWEGEQPTSDADACAIMIARSEDIEARLDRGEDPAPPTPEIADFTAALLRRWPDSGDNTPWAVSGAGYADGSSLSVHIRWGDHDEVSTFVAGLAKAHGLICYDPQQGRLRPALSAGR